MTPHWQIRPLRVVSCTVSWVVMGLLFAALPADMRAQGRRSDNRPTEVLEALGSEGISLLTVAQREARQLATILMGEREVATASAPKTLLRVLTEQTLRLGGRASLQLFVTTHLEGRLVGGRQTFASPVDHAPSSVQEDARRPRLLPTSQAMIALEILAR
ncbi:hypothetical protein NKDENANG_03448 [Candidatus Entotheonellaceae bacterium PAL068K]